MSDITKRVEALRRQVLTTPPTLRADRSCIAQKAYLAHQYEDKLVQRARIFEAVLNEIPINILPDELIVGLPGDDLNVAQVFFPENSPYQLVREINTLPTREQDRFLVPPKTKLQVLELASFWSGKTANDAITGMIGQTDQSLLDAGAFFIQKDMGYGHCLADYASVLSQGLAAYKQKAESLQSAPGATKEQKHFWRGVSIVCQAAVDYANRYAALAEEQARAETDAARKAELLKIAATCRKVPAHPAEDFYEALQSLWMTHLLIQLESDGTGVSFGRFDQYLYPYYRASAARGESQESLQELLDCFWIKTNHLLKYRSASAAKMWSGYIMNQNITICGTDAQGNDLTNELSYLCLACQRRLCLKEPQFSLRVSDNTPDHLIAKAAETLATGGGKPQFVSDRTIAQSLTSLGIAADAAADFAIIGCVEPGVVGGWGRFKSGHLNLPKILELMLNDGFDPVKQKRCGVSVGGLESLTTFDDFLNAFRKEFTYVFGRLIGIQKNITHPVLEREMPHVFLSTIYPDCLTKGFDFARGGARFNWSSFTITGMANIIDSCYTVKKLVYEDRMLPLSELNEALNRNYAGHEDLLQRIRSLPKYGNDIEEVDALGTRIANLLYDAADTFHAHQDTRVTLGYVTVTKSVSLGKYTGATADGRLAFEAFADGISPIHEYDVSGPTAVMNSSGKLNLARAGEGCILNQKFVPSALKEDYQRRLFSDFVKTYLLDLGGLHIQFNIVDKKTLLAAQANPSQYKNLLVRVSGFSAYFVDLNREIQEDVIGRTEFQSF